MENENSSKFCSPLQIFLAISSFFFLLHEVTVYDSTRVKSKRGLLALPSVLLSLLLQELNSRLDRAAEEKNDLLSNLSTLEERILSAENESNVLREKLKSLLEEKTGIENEMRLVRETLQTAEKEKEVCA